MTNLQAELARTIRAYASGDASFADLIAAEAALAEELLRGGDAAETREQAEEDLEAAREEHARTIEELTWRQKEAALELRLAELELILAEEDLVEPESFDKAYNHEDPIPSVPTRKTHTVP